ncbi:MAG TPA: hypothetical protein VNV62_00460 [Trebonia sp.]|jgi:hypothetical protein|nr:hypothetical protein [Trebonia sp.]
MKRAPRIPRPRTLLMLSGISCAASLTLGLLAPRINWPVTGWQAITLTVINLCWYFAVLLERLGRHLGKLLEAAQDHLDCEHPIEIPPVTGSSCIDHRDLN